MTDAYHPTPAPSPGAPNGLVEAPFRDEWGVDHIINGPHPTQYRGGWSKFDTQEDAERFAADPKRLNAKVMHRRVTDWTALASDAGRQG